MDQLVVGTLQERGIDRHHRLQPFAGQPGGESHRMLLGNADVVIAVRKAPVKLDHARAFAHGGRDGHQALVVLGHVTQPLPKHLRKGGLGRRGGRRQAHSRIELTRAVIGHRIGFGQLVALAFLGDHVQKLRPLLLGHAVADVLQRGDERIQVVPVNGPDVVEAKLLEQRRRHHHALGTLLDALGQLEQRRHRAEYGLANVLGSGVEIAAHQLRQIAVERADRRADRHVVVVEHHQQARIALDAGVVERLERHAGRHGAVADDGHRLAVFALLPRRHRHAKGGGNAGRGMGSAKGVVFAFFTTRKARDAAQLAQRWHALAPTGQDLVRIGLVPHIPHQPVVRRVENVVQGDGEFHRAEVGAEVTPGARHVLQHTLAHLVGQAFELRARQAAQVAGVFDSGE